MFRLPCHHHSTVDQQLLQQCQHQHHPWPGVLDRGHWQCCQPSQWSSFRSSSHNVWNLFSSMYCLHLPLLSALDCEICGGKGCCQLLAILFCRKLLLLCFTVFIWLCSRVSPASLWTPGHTSPHLCPIHRWLDQCCSGGSLQQSLPPLPLQVHSRNILKSFTVRTRVNVLKRRLPFSNFTRLRFYVMSSSMSRKLQD